MIDVREASKTVMLEFEDPIRVIERFLLAGERHRINARKAAH
jgi:hypothetical protein